MSLIVCKECKKEYSSSADCCPNCGYKPLKNRNVGCLGAIIAIIVCFFFVYSCINKLSDSPKTKTSYDHQKNIYLNENFNLNDIVFHDLVIKIKDVKTVKKIGKYSANNTYFKVYLEATNISDSDSNLFGEGVGYINGINNNNIGYEVGNSIFLKDEKLSSFTKQDKKDFLVAGQNVPANQTVSGFLLYDVEFPKGLKTSDYKLTIFINRNNNRSILREITLSKRGQ